jgi:hypothetical protein
MNIAIAAKYAMPMFRLLWFAKRNGNQWIMFYREKTFLRPGNVFFFKTEEEARMIAKINPALEYVELDLIYHSLSRMLMFNSYYPLKIEFDMAFLIWSKSK